MSHMCLSFLVSLCLSLFACLSLFLLSYYISTNLMFTQRNIDWPKGLDRDPGNVSFSSGPQEGRGPFDTASV